MVSRAIILISVLAASLVVADSQTRAPSGRPKDGFVPNAETTVKIGERY